MFSCRLCRRDGITEWLDFGPQALANRFTRSRDEAEYLHPCKVGVCSACGTLQLESPVPVEEMRPRYGWLTYNEPERHLDEVVAAVKALPGLGAGSTAAGISRYDTSTLRRLEETGVHSWVADPLSDLGVEHPFGGTESVQAGLTVRAAGRMTARYGRPDLLVIRYVLEHAHDPGEFLRAVWTLVRPGGYALFEVPDACKGLEKADYTTVWEEHVSYFTPSTLRQCLVGAGFEPVYLRRFYYSQQDALVAVAKPAPGPLSPAVTPGELAYEVDRADRFVRSFPRVRDRICEAVGGFARTRGKVAVLGAGHLSRSFINLYGLGDMIDFVADDNPHKQGLFMPGSKLPILPSSELLSRGVRLCLMTVRTEIEDAVAAKNAAFTARGRVLASVFPDSPYFWYELGRPAGKAA